MSRKKKFVSQNKIRQDFVTSVVDSTHRDP
jgi:hypothetical protein